MSRHVLQALLGIAVFLGIAWLLSENRRRVPVRAVLVGLLAQALIAWAMLRAPLLQAFFASITRGVELLHSATQTGTSFAFGYLAGGTLPFPVRDGGNTFIFAIQSLPMVLTIGALSALLWHWRVLMYAVRGAGWVVQRLFGVSGPVGVSNAACVFLGMVEAPLLVRPYIAGLSRSDLFVVMTGGMAVIAGSTMVLIASILQPRMPNAFPHLLIASLINAPMAISVARLMMPGEGILDPGPSVELRSPYRGALDALMTGTVDAVKLLANVIGLLIVVVALITLLNLILALVPHTGGPLTIQGMLGYVLQPVPWLMGIDWNEALPAASLLATKLVVNELFAYSDLMSLPAGTLSPHAVTVLTYALCSFGNLASLAIMTGALGTMAPSRMAEIVAIGPKSIVAAFLTTSISGAMVTLVVNS